MSPHHIANMSDRLSDKIALVTGGSRGIGAAVAKHLAAQGALVAITYNKSADRAEQVVKEIRSSGGRARALKSDASAQGVAAGLIVDVLDAFGGLDILINNAGAFAPGGIEERESEDYAANFDTNVRGVQAYTQAAVGSMRDGGRVITIGSGYGNRPPAGTGAYAASKAAVVAFSKAWAKELAPRAITVNVVSPGSIDTEMNPADAELNPSAEQQRQNTPLGRFGTPDEIAAVVAFLCGEEAAFVTGANIPVDGGYTA